MRNGQVDLRRETVVNIMEQLPAVRRRLEKWNGTKGMLEQGFLTYTSDPNTQNICNTPNNPFLSVGAS